MHSREQKAALERLASDLRSIRTIAERTLTEVHEDTRVPLEVLRRLEKNLLINDSMFNEVYVRSILRGFAKAVGFPAERILDAFQEASEGRYGKGPRLVDESARPDPEDIEVSEDVEEAVEKASSDESTQEPPSSRPPAEGITSDRPAVSPDTSRRSKKRFVLPKFDFKKGGIGILVLASVATGVFVIARMSQPDDPQDAIVASEVSEATDLIPGARDGSMESVEPLAAETFTMPDTISVAIFSTNGVFDPIRVRTDRDLRRPYWADSSDTLQFQIVDRIIVEDHLDRMGIKIENQLYPVNRSAGALRLDRQDIREFLESRNSSGR